MMKTNSDYERGVRAGLEMAARSIAGKRKDDGSATDEALCWAAAHILSLTPSGASEREEALKGHLRWALEHWPITYHEKGCLLTRQCPGCYAKWVTKEE